jgi:hypothetical protein
VTDDAFEVFKFVLYECNIISGNFFVASLTGYFYVFAFEFKFGFIVVEFLDIPIVIAVAFRTIGHAELLKLFVVTVFVAARTGGR